MQSATQYRKYLCGMHVCAIRPFGSLWVQLWLASGQCVGQSKSVETQHAPELELERAAVDFRALQRKNTSLLFVLKQGTPTSKQS